MGQAVYDTKESFEETKCEICDKHMGYVTIYGDLEDYYIICDKCYENLAPEELNDQHN